MEDENIYKLVEDDIGIPREITCYGDLKIHKGKMFYPTKFKGYYVNTDGEVLGKYNRIMKGYSSAPKRKDGGYYQITIKEGEKKLGYCVHVLVAETLIPLPLIMVELEVDHINYNIKDNRKINLRWLTHEENMWRRRHSPFQLLSKDAYTTQT
jgi:hypothetical protein